MDITWHMVVASGVTALVAVVTVWLWAAWPRQASRSAAAADKLAAAAAALKRLQNLPPPAQYIQDLAAELPPGRVLLPRDCPTDFMAAVDTQFSIQNREIEPACIVQPTTADELGVAMRHIAREHTERSKGPATSDGLFGVRCSGANPGEGFSGVKNGVVLDMSKCNAIDVSEDRTQVVVGGGCLWKHVYGKLDAEGLAVVGGRASPVGIGGSTLGGGMSFYSGQHGFMCSNVLNYKVVLADGSIVNASATENPDLWRALKGGCNNFGVVVEFTLRCFPAGPVWAGSHMTPGFMYKSALKAFYDYGMQVSSRPSPSPSVDSPGNKKTTSYDPYAGVPIMSITQIPELGISLWFTHLAYTKPPVPKMGDRTWPEHWRKSPFHSLWGFGSNHKVTTLAEAVESLGEHSLRDQRNIYAVAGFKLNLDTLTVAYKLWAAEFRNVRDVRPRTSFAMTYQLINPMWMHKGDPNVLGLEGCEDPLVVVGFAVNWRDQKHDALLKTVVGRVVKGIEAASKEHGSYHPYRFTNYGNETQNPLLGYGEENMRFMKDVSRRYDPKGLFQTGCLGGFKLGREDL